ncbi:MAG: hypothetical protein Nk1A_9160 [Endomicrobiia bacterium]|nr:MAG: hypothetical protein Nk1A_9160 [Endomicrobiia bacterium]
MSTDTIRAEVVATKEEPGGYIVIVVLNTVRNEYLMCTKLPNWSCRTPVKGEIGYLQYREFIAGEDTWYDFSKGEKIPFKYTGLYFWNFVKEEDEENTEITL